MKKQKYLPAFLLSIGMMVFFLQGCYTQMASIREEEPSYRQEEQYSQQNDSTYNNEGENENWQPHNYVGFSYYYPGWCSYSTWDYGCAYPAYWNPWYWGPAFYLGYSYYPHYGGYWNSYSRYNHWAFGGHYNNLRQYATRNSGYQRNGSGRVSYGIAGSNGSVGSGAIRGGVALPRDASTTVQTGRYNTTKNLRSGYSGVSTSRQSSSRYNPSVQQPRHRDQSAATTNRSYRNGSSRGHENYRNQGSSNGQSRSSGRSSAPSYSPQPSSRTNSAPSTPAPRGDGGGGRQSSGSGRSR